MRRKILIADDDRGVREILKHVLSDNYSVHDVSCGEDAVKELTTGAYEILFLDLSMPGMDGLDVLNSLKQNNIEVDAVIISASNDLEKAVQAMKLGAYDYIAKPIDVEKIKLIARNISDKLSLKNEVFELRKKVSDGFRFSSVISVSPAMKKLFSLLNRVIDTDITILISGESGTGKGLLADAVHFNSNRSLFPFRSLDCSTIPKDLIESELFGHEKGAFTGAHSRKIGKFELADKGTLFLDEVGNLSFDVQAKLLKVLQEKRFERLGGNEVVEVNTRIISASNKNLKTLVSEGKFREDLYYRLNVFPVEIPPLRQRREDIPVLINYFLTKFNSEYGRDVVFSDKAVDFFCKYEWPGNVRELENAMRRIVLISVGKEISAEYIKSIFDHISQDNIDIPQANIKSNYQTLDEVEKKAILESLRLNSFNISKTSSVLGISRKTLHNKLRAYGISVEKKIAEE
ncbi:MAG TPA: sigma-54 dependent transcriptional regulator [Spirochaetota bacterium]|nr:sigma-54 dependent transcriptional regulator [Spirochaetota bacterium]HOR43424.1 sigma-54 dependent transcriptional regulator [Spirochaetota bacterium]HOU83455.1 sigma-54 dependent transcriptional regulator [Spirochaetota bacterium]HPK56378.1 sigma-54 dependent transcriptional regulator [Spirochaetota bacterium]HQE58409.1 sigma-54 dependent transcriptional regulator [Spirochaetota bacterium]